MSLVERCWDCQELELRCVCGLTEERAEIQRTKSVIPSREAQVAAFIRSGPSKSQGIL